MTWIDTFLGRVNRKCTNCGQLLLADPEDTQTVAGAPVCSTWCADYYREHRHDD